MGDPGEQVEGGEVGGERETGGSEGETGGVRGEGPGARGSGTAGRVPGATGALPTRVVTAGAEKGGIEEVMLAQVYAAVLAFLIW